MKTIKFSCYVLALILFAACSKEETPQPDPTPQSALEELVADKYWTEEIYFMRWCDSVQGGALVQDEEQILEFGNDGGWSLRPESVALGTIYVGRDGKVYRYFQDKYGVYSTYYANQYTISYDPNGRSLQIDAAVDSLHYMGAVTGLDMMVAEMYEDQIVFDVPIIKEYISTRWNLYQYVPHIGSDRVVGLRIYWKQRSAHNFKYAEPLD